jgi:NAD(P)-dependent dehydrogenase (short-subunit alcohol dehydrogenase family)
VIIYLKTEIDYKLDAGIDFRNLSGHVAIVTGGNSGVGLGIVKQLVSIDCHVIMTCRTLEKCQSAIADVHTIYPNKTGLITPMELDLSDLDTVWKFSTAFQQRFHRLDYLINNAGAITKEGQLTKQGLEEALGSMHIGHFALTKWLLPLLITPIQENNNILNPARIINVASEAFVVGNFHPSIFSETGMGDFQGESTDNCPFRHGLRFLPCCPMGSCPYTNGYARAKLANILHVQELQRRYDAFLANYTRQTNLFRSEEQLKDFPFRRLVTASLHPGGVQTNIAPLLKNSPHFLRDSDQAAYVVMHALFSDEFVPGAFLDSMKGAHDLIRYSSFGLENHIEVFSSVIHDLKFVQLQNHPSQRVQNFSLHGFAWDQTTYIQPMIPELEGKGNEEIVHMLKMRLWDVSENIVNNYMQGKPLLGNKIHEVPFQMDIPVVFSSSSSFSDKMEETPAPHQSEVQKEKFQSIQHEEL